MTTSKRLVIGTRGSALALWQANHVAAEIRRLRPEFEVEIEVIVTSGDRFQSAPVAEVGGKAVWVKEIEEALLAGRIDLAVHSLKDVPAVLPDGLSLGAYPLRADARDAWLSRKGISLADLPAGTKVGTSSLRRRCQLLAKRPDLKVEVLRGNVDTRLAKLETGNVEAAILACAGLDRLGHGSRITERLAPEFMLPAIGQGCMTIELRFGDPRVASVVAMLDHAETRAAVVAERALMAGLGGSCHTPVAGYAQVNGSVLTLTGLVGNPDGSTILKVVKEGDVAKPAALGTETAKALLSKGADALLAELGE